MTIGGAIGKTGDAYLLDRDNLSGGANALLSARVMAKRTMASPAVRSPGDAFFIF